MAGLLEGLRALGSGRVLDDVLTLVLDSAIDVTGAERGFIMLANEDERARVQARAGARQVTLSGTTFETSRKIPETVFATGQQAIVEDLLDSDLAQLHTRHGRARHPVTCSARRFAWCATSSGPKNRPADKMIGVLYLDSRERGALRSSGRALGARDAEHGSRRRDRERAAVPRSASSARSSIRS